MALDAPGDYVTLTLASEHPTLFYRYHGQNFSIAPGSKKIVPWGHMDFLLGSPFLVGFDRENRLKTIMNARGAKRVEDLSYRGLLTADDPDGDPIITIIDDPLGEHALLASDTEALDPAAIRATMDAMNKRMKDMERLLTESEAADAARADTPEPDSDEPPAPVKKAAAKKAAARKRAAKKEAEAEVVEGVIGDVPHLTPVDDIPDDGPMDDKPTRTPTNG